MSTTRARHVYQRGGAGHSAERCLAPKAEHGTFKSCRTTCWLALANAQALHGPRDMALYMYCTDDAVVYCVLSDSVAWKFGDTKASRFVLCVIAVARLSFPTFLRMAAERNAFTNAQPLALRASVRRKADSVLSNSPAFPRAKRLLTNANV